MARQVRELMSKHTIMLGSGSPVIDAARQMRAENIGAVVVQDDNTPCGIVTDRDIVVRAVAQGKDLQSTPLSDICSKDLTTVSPDDDIDRAVKLMREKSVRRMLVADQGKIVGMVSLGDLAMEKDAGSALGQISAAPPNR